MLQQALVTDKFVRVGQRSLLVFDECHNAVGNSPMAAVMRDAVAPYVVETPSESPRILGLTASFVEKKRRDLEALLLSTIFCPTVPQRVSDEKFKAVQWKRCETIDREEDALKAHVESILERANVVKEVKKVVARCAHVFVELGMNALFFYIDKVIVQQIIDKAQELNSLGDDASRNFAQRLLGNVSVLRGLLVALQNNLKAD
jgi:hypothetical protein